MCLCTCLWGWRRYGRHTERHLTLLSMCRELILVSELVEEKGMTAVFLSGSGVLQDRR